MRQICTTEQKQRTENENRKGGTLEDISQHLSDTYIWM